MGTTPEWTPIAAMVRVAGREAPSGTAAIGGAEVSARAEGDPAPGPGADVPRVIGEATSMRPTERGGCGARTCAATAITMRAKPTATATRASSERPLRWATTALRRDIEVRSDPRGRTLARE